jgi:predicted transcriptional regulator
MANRPVSAPVAPEDYEHLRRLARAGDRSVSSLIRIAIRNYIESSEAAGQGGSAKTSVQALGHEE